MLNNKVAFITGSTGDLGIEIAKKLIKKKYKLICQIRKTNKKFDKFKSQNKKDILEILVFDFLNEKKIPNSMKKISKKYNKIDVLIVNAAIPYGGIFEMTKIDMIKKVFEINFFSQLLIIQKLLKLLKKSKNPSIINISSVASFSSKKGNIPYGGSKAVLNYATKILANELSNYKIRVNAIAPSVLENKMGNLMNEKSKKELIDNSFQKKTFKMNDVVELIVFLLSSKSRSINGQILRIDGGMEI
jgi:3-oxoacyl-[acyl-carrier protein] reductase